MHRQIDRRAVVVFAMALVAVSIAGPEFIEDNDAGTNSTGASPVAGLNNGPVNAISGRLLGVPQAGLGGGSDFEDVYLINIVDPANFSATTSPLVGGLSEFDAALYVLTADGQPLLGNLETTGESTEPFGDTAAGVSWTEIGDAGGLPGSAQAALAIGGGTLSSITGFLEAGLDHEDMYVVNISDPEAFMASTFSGGGSSTFGADLWLFQVSGIGLLGNRAFGFAGNIAGHLSPVLGPERLGPNSNDKSGAAVTDPGIYLLAVSYDGNHPFSGGGNAIFHFQLPAEISGPDGAGGGAPIVGWTDELGIANGAAGSGGVTDLDEYSIALSGVEFLADGSSTIGPVSNDGTNIIVDQPGFYLLAISSDTNRPLSAAAEPLYLFQIPDEISGPDGPGAPDVLSIWDSNASLLGQEFGTGEYLIILNGVGSVPTSDLCGDLDHDGDVDHDDLDLFFEAFGSQEGDPNYNPDADLNDNGIVGPVDFGLWLKCYHDANHDDDDPDDDDGEDDD